MVSWNAWANALRHWQWIGMLLARLSVGLLFMLSGAGKLFSSVRREQMRQTMVSAHISVPEISGIFVSSVECVFGALLVVGFLTPLCCLMLTLVMVGALSTTVLRGIKGRSAVSWLSEFLYLPEVLYVVILVWLLLSGPGWFSLDHLLLSSPSQ